MAESEVLEKVFKLKELLNETTESKKVLKTLKRLQDLKITLDILAETGIGKTVNCFRKHEIAGDLAKALVNQWKKLVPKETNSSSLAQDDHPPEKQESAKKKKGDFLKEKKTSSNIAEKRHSTGQDKRGFEKSEFVPKEMSKTVNTKTLNDQASEGHKDEEQHIDSGKHCPTSGNTLESNGDLEDCSDKKPSRSTKASHNPPPEKKAPIHVDKDKHDHKQTNKESPSFNSVTEEMCSSAKSFVKKDKKSTDVANDDYVKHDRKSTRSTENRSAALGELEMDKAKSRKSVKFIEKEKSGDGDFEEPTMSFETCLNYDLGPTFKKRKKPSEIQKLTKKHKNHDSKTESLGKKVSEKDKSMTEKKNIKSEDSPKKVESGSIMDLLNVPLPSFLPDCFLFPSPYMENKKQAEVPNTFEDTTGFTGQRLNSKMQVYSGAKTVFLPGMMTLYQQCIHALQNNIDSLYECGGVPFEILEPVLEHCTPEQLYRIEECNPAYIGDTDHLWIKHCQKEFKNERPQEYEAWREMYLRLFEERERKFKLLTKSIVSAHSGKPKGRQVKRAFIHSVAKPPREVRRKQEIYGTAGSTAQPHSVDKMKISSVKTPESKARHSSSDLQMSSAGPSQDPKKMSKKIAPMMAKSLKIFKSRLVRR
ncbi:elongin-A-like [Acipenser oxyrinchus oxyrinchus]|uniref:Elongin-A-like n=1 Tax=Acipenser oxyrinchus oxyrinchus TaxID=40147 RepID=A0AAD8LML1_ACIOX|nr:elongin-A-like [Acipenser oxyrinchus oxyrinchus]